MKKLCICMILSLALSLIFAVLLTAHDEHQKAVTPVKKFKEGDKFIIALVPEKNVFDQRRRYKYVTDYLSQKLNLNIRAIILPSYGAICGALLRGDADAGFFGSFSYVLTHKRTGIEPVARPVWPDASSTYSGYIFVRKDSGISKVEDMKGKSLALVHKATTAGYVFQLDYFKKHGIDMSGSYFSRVNFAGSHDSSAWAVYTGEVDVGGGKNHVFNALGREHPDFRNQMTVLAESAEVPSNGLAVSSSLDHDLKNRIRQSLLDLDKSSEGMSVLDNFKAVKFIKTENDDYASLYRMVEAAGIDLSDYTCEN